MVARHAGRLAANLVHNAAALIVDVRTGGAVAYVGNVPDLADEYRPNVDIVTAPRSPGSLLKPALYGMALSSGIILPETLLPDVPVTYGDFSPANFSASFSGAVPANRALTQSLNRPFVELLRDYGTPNFHRDLQQQGFRHLYRPADDYGLSLVLGGCEITLEEAVGWFAGTSRRRKLLRRPGADDPDLITARPLTSAAGIPCWKPLPRPTPTSRPVSIPVPPGSSSTC